MFVPGQSDAVGSLVGFKIWVWQIKGVVEVFSQCKLFPLLMAAPSSLHSFMAPTGLQDMNVAAIVVPDNERLLLAEEEQAQQDTNDLRQALEDTTCKCDELMVKCCKAQAALEKHKVAQCEVDVKVRGRLLVNAAMAEVQRWAMHQAEKVRKAAEKLCLEWEASQSPWKVQLRLGVSFFLFLLSF